MLPIRNIYYSNFCLYNCQVEHLNSGNIMQRKLISSGTGWALYMPKDVIKLLGYSATTTLVVLTMNKNILKISKVHPDNTNPNALIKKFNRCGNGYELYISNSIIQFLELNPEKDEVKYEIENDILFILKANPYSNLLLK